MTITIIVCVCVCVCVCVRALENVRNVRADRGSGSMSVHRKRQHVSA
jgi:hypothetical protein